MNHCFLSGRLTRNCHVNTLQSGTSIVNFSVAVEEVGKKQDGTEFKKVNYIECVKWTRNAVKYADTLVKGAPVTVLGSIQSESWEDKKTGAKRSAIKVKAARVILERDIDVARTEPKDAEQMTTGGAVDNGNGHAPDDENMPF